MGDGSTAIGEDYMLEDSYKDSARLHVQDWIWQSQLGFLLHPHIEESLVTRSKVSVLDIGCANAIWLLSLSFQKPHEWDFTGVDVSEVQFSSKEDLPKNVVLRKLNAFDPIPDDLKGRFDVLHIRAFTLVIRGGDPSPFLTNVLELLKPGGFIQWNDIETSSSHIHRPNSDISIDNTSIFIQKWQGMSAVTGLKHGWVSQLDETFKSAKLDEVLKLRKPPKPALRSATTANVLLGFEEVGRVVVPQNPALMGTKEEFDELFGGVVKEAARGVSIDVDYYCVIGRKGADA